MAEGEKSPRQLMVIGILGGLIGIYIASYLNSWTGTAWFSFIAALGAILAVYYGADAVRRVASYGLGTGVPSIAMLSFGAGQIAVLLGLAVAVELQHWSSRPYNRTHFGGDYRSCKRSDGKARYQNEHRHNGNVDDGNRNGSVPGYSRFQHGDRW